MDPIGRRGWRRLWLGVALTAAVGCGGIQERVAEAIRNQLGQLVAGVDDATLAAAQELLSEADVPLAAIEDDESVGDLQDEFAATDAQDLGSMGGFGPSLAPLAALAEIEPQRSVSRETYPGGRLRHLHIEETFPRGIVSGRVVDVYFVYSSTTGVTGDLNDTAPRQPYAFVYATVTATASFRTREDADPVPDAVLSGWRHWHSDPQRHFLAFDLTLTLPEHPRAPFRSLQWLGSYDDEAGSGSFQRIVTFADDSTDNRTWEVQRTAAGLAVQYTRDARDGMHAEGSGTIDLGGTRRCRLDDVVDLRIVRTFPSEETTATVAVSEVVEIAQDGLETTTRGWLYLSDGSVRQRHATRTVVEPQGCDQFQGTWRVQEVGVTYRGVTVETTISRADGSLVATSTRTRPDGSVVDVVVVRAQGITEIDVTVTAPDGTVVRQLTLTVAPGGHAEGTLTITRPDGTVEVIEIERETSGRFKARAKGRPRSEFRRINRGEL